MTKADISDAIYNQIGGFSKREAADVVDKVLDVMKDTLAKGEKLKISGFGSFSVRSKHARKGRNPQTGETITIAPRRVVTFKASQMLKDRLNNAE